MSAVIDKPAARPGPGRYLLVRSLGQTFAVPIACVRSALKIEAVTRVPRSAPHLLGLINLRGEIVTATCLRRRLQPSAAPAGSGAFAVTIELDQETYALAVDEVGEVVSANAENILPVPDHAQGILRALSLGVLRYDGAIASVLNVDALFDFGGRAQAA